MNHPPESVMRLYEAAGETRLKHKLRGKDYQSFAAGVEVLAAQIYEGLDTDDELIRSLRQIVQYPECSDASVYLLELGSKLLE